MKYQAKVLTKNHNVSHQHPLREAVILAAGAAVILFSLLWLSGKAVDYTVEHMSPATELKLHQWLGPSVKNSVEGLENKDSSSLNTLLNSLSDCADLAYPVQINLLNSSELNAMALPGGQMIVMSHVLDAPLSENGLAFVLAHELAHFKHRDHLRGMGRGIIMATLAVLVGTDNSDFLTMMSPFSGLEMAQHSQYRESMADRFALDILYCHYGHVGGMTEFFELLATESMADQSAVSHYFSTHPQLTIRIENLQQIAGEKGYEIAKTIELSR